MRLLHMRLLHMRLLHMRLLHMWHSIKPNTVTASLNRRLLALFVRRLFISAHCAMCVFYGPSVTEFEGWIVALLVI